MINYNISKNKSIIPGWVKATTPISAPNSRHFRIWSTFLYFSRTSFEMRSCSVSFKEMTQINRVAGSAPSTENTKILILWTVYVHQLHVAVMPWGVLLVSFTVVSLMSDAKIWIIFSPWYRWQLATHPETKHHTLQLHVNCCCYLCPRNTKTSSNHFHAHILWRVVCVCVCSAASICVCTFYLFVENSCILSQFFAFIIVIWAKMLIFIDLVHRVQFYR